MSKSTLLGLIICLACVVVSVTGAVLAVICMYRVLYMIAFG